MPKTPAYWYLFAIMIALVIGGIGAANHPDNFKPEPVPTHTLERHVTYEDGSEVLTFRINAYDNPTMVDVAGCFTPSNGCTPGPVDLSSIPAE